MQSEIKTLAKQLKDVTAQKQKLELQQSPILNMGLKINQKQAMLEDSERRGVLADYMNNRQRSGIISSKVKMTNRFMDMDFLGGKEQAQRVESNKTL
jgi:septal ring factor EnvC (AmiA/AmiB activator)